MRILMVTHSFPRVEGDVAGASLWRLGEALALRGHDVSVIAPADQGEVGEPMLGRVRVRRVRYASSAAETLAYQGTMHRQAARSPLAALTFWKLVRAMSRAVSEEITGRGAQLVHAHWWVPGGLAVRRAERHGRQFIVTLHGTDVALAGRFPGGRSAMSGVLKQAATVTAVASYLAAEAAEAMDVARTTFPITPMPLGTGFMGDLDAARSGVVYVGSLAREKGVHILLEALAMLRRDGMPLDLTIVGDGPERANLKAQSRALGLTTTFTGFIARELVAEHLHTKQAFVLPALDQGVGLVVAEALAHGVPVVASRSGGIPDLLADPEAGILVPPGDAVAVASAIRSVIKEERYRVGAWRAGRILVDQRSPEHIAEQFEALYTRSRTSRVSADRTVAR